MSNFDDIFASQNGSSQWKNQSFDKEAWAAKKQEERKEIYELADTTAVEISKDGEKFQKYLDVQARFDRYSPTNALLIYAQMPEATQLKDFEGWKDAGVSVQRKPKSVKILEPGKEYNRDNGGRGTSFDVKRVYDVSQTKGRVRSAPNVKLDDRVLLKKLSLFLCSFMSWASASPCPPGATTAGARNTVLPNGAAHRLSTRSIRTRTRKPTRYSPSTSAWAWMAESTAAI